MTFDDLVVDDTCPFGVLTRHRGRFDIEHDRGDRDPGRAGTRHEWPADRRLGVGRIDHGELSARESLADHPVEDPERDA